MEDIRFEKLSVGFPVRTGFVDAVDQVTAVFRSGEITGIIGESGCGKSVLLMALLGLLPSYACVSGDIFMGGLGLFSLSAKEMRAIRGRKIGLIAQNPADSFNPVRKIKGQLIEALRLKGNKSLGSHGFLREGVRLLMEFGFTEAEACRVLKSYPFQLSGGMQQRAIAAMGIASGAAWVLADEPSKGLDQVLRQQMYGTLREVKKRRAEGMILITHDIELARTLCDRVAVMYSGQLVEMGKDVLERPRHPYTTGLINSLPSKGMNAMRGIAPAPGERLAGCKFAPRCPLATRLCREGRPKEHEDETGMVRCFLYD